MAKIKKVHYSNGDFKEYDKLGNLILLYQKISFPQDEEIHHENVPCTTKFIYDKNSKLIKKIETRIYQTSDFRSYEKIYEARYEYSKNTRLEYLYLVKKQVWKYHFDDYVLYDDILNKLISIVELKESESMVLDGKNEKIKHVLEKTTNLVNNKIILVESKFVNNELTYNKNIDFQQNTVSELINDYESNLIKSNTEYNYKLHEERKLSSKKNYLYNSGVLISVKNYQVKESNLVLDFEIRYKYDNEGRLIEEIKGDFEKNVFSYAVDYLYSFVNQYNPDCIECSAITKLEYINSFSSESNLNLMSVTEVSVEIYDEENKEICYSKLNYSFFNSGFNFKKCIGNSFKYIDFNNNKFNEIEFDKVSQLANIIQGEDYYEVDFNKIDYYWIDGSLEKFKETAMSINAFGVKINRFSNYEYY